MRLLVLVSLVLGMTACSSKSNRNPATSEENAVQEAPKSISLSDKRTVQFWKFMISQKVLETCQGVSCVRTALNVDCRQEKTLPGSSCTWTVSTKGGGNTPETLTLKPKVGGFIHQFLIDSGVQPTCDGASCTTRVSKIECSTERMIPTPECTITF